MPCHKPSARLRRALLLSRVARKNDAGSQAEGGQAGRHKLARTEQRRIELPAGMQECTVQPVTGLGLTCAMSRSPTPCRMSKAAPMSGQRPAACKSKVQIAAGNTVQRAKGHSSNVQGC